jgi:hypothetical protein
VDQGGYILNEDLAFIHEYFKPIIHKFIFKFRDINREMIEEIYESLFEYLRVTTHGHFSERELKGLKHI